MNNGVGSIYFTSVRKDRKQLGWSYYVKIIIKYIKFDFYWMNLGSYLLRSDYCKFSYKSELIVT